MHLCEVSSDRGKAIEWRPQAQHALHLRDGHFDSRFNAYLRCERSLHNLYKSVIEGHHEELLEKLINEIKHTLPVSQPADNTSSRKTPLTCITSALSKPDMEVLVDFLIDCLNFRSDYVVLSLACHNTDSALDLLCEVANSLRIATNEIACTDRRAASLGIAMASKLKSEPIREIYEMPSHAILDMLAACEAVSSQRGLLLLLQNAEGIDSEVFSDFIEIVHNMEGLHVHIITLTSAICPLPLRLTKSAQCVVEVSVFNTKTNWEIYDDFIGRVVSLRELPVSLTASVWSWIHETFWRSNCCVRSALDMVLRGLRCHFSRRVSLLCMFEETQWLAEMKLVKKGGKTEQERQWSAIHDIIGYMDQEDIRGTGLVLAQANSAGRNAEVSLAKRKLAANVARARIDKSWFLCLRDIRDAYLFYHADGGARLDRSEFCSDILWAAVTSTDSSIASHVDDLISAVSKLLTKVPVRAIHSLIQRCTYYLADVDAHLVIIYETGSEEVVQLELSSPTAPVVHMPTNWRKTKGAMLGECKVLKSELGDQGFLFEEMLETMRFFGVLPNACQAELPRKEGGNKLKTTSTSVPVASMSGGDGVGSSALFRSPVRKKTSSVAPGASAVSPTESSLEVNADLHDKYPSPLRTKPPSPVEISTPYSSGDAPKPRPPELSSPAGFIQENLFPHTENAIEDFVTWMHSAAAFFFKIPRPDAIPGVLDMESGAIAGTFAAADGSIRSVYFKSLSRTQASSDRSIIINGTSIPDIVVLSKIVFKSVSTASVSDWFSTFKGELSTWETPDESKRKRKRESEHISEAMLLKARFCKSLSDLELFGLIKIKSGGLEVSRISYMWMTE
jgi:hypothetical protein